MGRLEVCGDEAHKPFKLHDDVFEILERASAVLYPIGQCAVVSSNYVNQKDKYVLDNYEVIAVLISTKPRTLDFKLECLPDNFYSEKMSCLVYIKKDCIFLKREKDRGEGDCLICGLYLQSVL